MRFSTIPALACLFLTLAHRLNAAETNPSKLATVARIDLNAAPQVRALTGGSLTKGSGWINRQTWLPTNEWKLAYTAQMPIVRFAWNEFELNFTPEASGTVQLSLRGPWEEVTPGSGIIYQQEVLWDAFAAQGALLANSSFESLSNGKLLGWTGGQIQWTTPAAPAPDGERLARTWHDGSMNQTLAVRANVPVRLRFQARASIPAGFPDMKPVQSRETPAHQAALQFMRGVNFGNYLDSPPESGGRIVYTAADFAAVREEGFDHIRIPVAWHHYTGPAPHFTLDPQIFSLVDFMVTNTLNRGLSALLDAHNFEAFTDAPHAHTNQLYAMWRQIAAYYSNAPPALAFEILNEPRDEATTQIMNPIFAEAIRQIRLTNPRRTLFIGPGDFNGISELNNLMLPDDDLNLIATVHTYDPFLFTHQGQPWAGTDAAALAGIQFPGPPSIPLVPKGELNEWAAHWLRDYNTLPEENNPSGPSAFRGRFQFIKQWSEYYGRPVHIGEFGAFETIDPQSRLNYYRAKRGALEELELSWAIWDWKAGFHYWKEGAPEPPGLREALFPPPALRTAGPGQLQIEASRGKRIIIERVFPGQIPWVWHSITTQQMVSTNWEFSDVEWLNHSAVLYRVHWLK